MNRRTATRLLALLTFGFMGGATATWAQRKEDPEWEQKTRPESGDYFVFRAPPETKDTTLLFDDHMETLTLRYKGKEKKINIQELIDAL